MAKNKTNKEFDSSMQEMLRPKITDILLATVLLCCGAVLLFIYIKAPQELVDIKSYYRLTLIFPLCDLAVAAAVFFKGGFFRWFSLTAWTAKMKGVDRKRVYPTMMYVMTVKVFALIFALVNSIFMILVIRKVV